MSCLNSIKLSTLKLRFLSNNFLLNVCKVLAISGLALFLIDIVLEESKFPHFSSSNFFSSLRTKYLSPSSSNSTSCPSDHSDPPTVVSHLVFGLITGVKIWQRRKPFIDTWWRPNVTRGYLFLDKPPAGDLLPWDPTSPPFRVSDNTSKLERETKHVAPVMVRMVHAILETFREGDEGVRWYVMGFDDTVVFVDNMVEVLGKYDHTKYYYIGDHSESVMSNEWFSFEQGFGGGGFALSYPLAAAMANDLKGCIARYPYLRSHDTIVQFCADEFGVPLTVEKGIHQIDLFGDISGFLHSHPPAPLVSLHHLDFVNPIFPKMNMFNATNHLIEAGKYGQSRLLQQTVCYDKKRSWSFSVSWGYSVYIYEGIHARGLLKRPLETFKPWNVRARPPKYMFNTRSPCETPVSIFFFETIEKKTTWRNKILATYGRALPFNCPGRGNISSDLISRIRVLSPVSKPKDNGKSECCDAVHVAGTNVAEVKLRTCGNDEIIG